MANIMKPARVLILEVTHPFVVVPALIWLMSTLILPPSPPTTPPSGHHPSTLPLLPGEVRFAHRIDP